MTQAGEQKLGIAETLAAARKIGELFARRGTSEPKTTLRDACEILGNTVGADIVAMRSVGPDGFAHFEGGWATTPILSSPQVPLKVRDSRGLEQPLLARTLDEMPISAERKDLAEWAKLTPTAPQTLFCPVRSGSETLGYLCLVGEGSLPWDTGLIDAVGLAACVIGQFQLRVWSERTQQRRHDLSTFVREWSHRFFSLKPGEESAAFDTALAELGQVLNAVTVTVWDIDLCEGKVVRRERWATPGAPPAGAAIRDLADSKLAIDKLEVPQVVASSDNTLTYTLAPGFHGSNADICLSVSRRFAAPWEEWELDDIASFADNMASVRAKLATDSQLRASFNQAPRGISLRSLDGTFIDCNQAYLDFLHTTKEDLPAPGLAVVTLDEIPAQKRLAIEQGDFQQLDGMELPYLRGDGATVWGRVSVVKMGSGSTAMWMTHVEDVTRHRRALEDLRVRAATDTLTGAANRETITRTLDGVLALAQPASSDTGWDAAPCAVILLDLNGFKTINDTFGLATGDRVLAELTERLDALVRPKDLVGRTGGDEFVVVLPGPVRASDALTMTKRLRSSFATPFPIDGGKLEVSASVGMALALADDTADAVLARADVAMQNEKFEARLRQSSLKRGQAAADGATGQHLADTLLILNDTSAVPAPTVTPLQFADALKAGEITFWCQPIAHVPTGAPLGVELLARWPQKDGSFIEPDDFVPLAERSGHVVELGRQALSMGARLLERWAGTKEFAHLGVNVNVSPLHLAHGLIEDVHALVPELPSNAQLGLEIIESGLADGAREHLRALDGLVDRGIRVIIDDFGIGHSSLSRLQQFPASNLKLDKSFISDIVENEERQRFFRAIVRLLFSAGYPVTVEGVETAEQMALVRSGHAQGAQGFFIARPAPVQHTEHVLREMIKSSATPLPHSTNGPSGF